MTTILIHDHIKREIAEKVVQQARPDYNKAAHGEWFVVDGEKVMSHGRIATGWSPWAATAHVISVDDLVFQVGGAARDNASFDPSPTPGETEEQAYERAIAAALACIPDSYDTETVESHT